MKKFVSILCSVCLIVFLAEAGLSLLDNSLGLVLGVRIFLIPRILLSLIFFPIGLLTYVMIGVSPMVPKRWFLPVVFFGPAALLGMLLFSIYHFDLAPAAAWGIALLQVVLGLWILFRAQGKFAVSWPLVPEQRLGDKAFGWMNLVGFVFGNGFVLAPGVVAYLLFCATAAVDHFSGSFLKLQSDGLVARAKTYVRDDGKTILLMPMMHIAEPDFYAEVQRSFPSNAVILMEGVSDDHHLLDSKIDYSRAASTLGLSTQKQEFIPPPENVHRADVDVDVFSRQTIEMLNLIFRIQSDRSNTEAVRKLSRDMKDPSAVEQLKTDLLSKRNEHLLGEINAELPQASEIVVPWGAAHMPGISAAIEKEGFHLSGTREFKIFNFSTLLDALAKQE